MTAHPPSPSHLRHLAGRALASLRSRPLSPREESEVAGLVDGELARLFWAQPAMDQRHALEAARTVFALRPGDTAAARAALMHDIGKRHSGLGVIGRTLATLFALLRVPAPGRLGTYLDHARLGADDLAAAGAEPMVVAYARHQDGDRPEAIPTAVWRVLKAADGESHRLDKAAQYDDGRAEQT